MNNVEKSVRCPKCGRTYKVTLNEMVPGKSKPCPYCRTPIKFKGDDGRKLQKTLDSIKNFKKTVKIKL